MADAQPSLPLPDSGDRRLEPERGTLRLLVRAPETFPADWNGITLDDFTHPAYRALFESVLAVSGGEQVGDGNGTWTHRLLQANPDPILEQLLVTLAVEPVLREPTQAYAREYSAQLRVQTVARRIQELKSKLQRTNPLDDQPAYDRMFAKLVNLEKERKELLALATGPSM